MKDINEIGLIRKIRRCNKKTISILILTVILVFVGIFIVGILISNNNRKVYEIGKETIKENEISFYCLKYIKKYSLYDKQELDKEYAKNVTYDDYYKNQMLDEIVNIKMLYLCAIDEGIKLNKEDKKEIQNNIEDITVIIGQDTLDKYGVKKKTIEKAVTEEYYAYKLKEELTKDIEVVEQESYIHYYNILFSTVEIDESGYIITDEQGNVKYLDSVRKSSQKELANQVYDRLTMGESLQNIIEEYNIERNCKDQYNTESGLTQACKKALDSVSIGQYTSVYEDEYGYNINLLISLNDEEYASLINEFDSQLSRESVWEERKTELIAKLNVSSDKMYDKNWNRISLKNYIIKE